MPLRQIFTPGGGVIDRWAAQQRAALQMALSKRNRELYVRVLDISGPFSTLRVWVEPGINIPPGWAIATQGSDLVVTIRGTSNAQQWIAHFAGNWGRKYQDDPGGAYVHSFMYEVVVQQVFPSVLAVLAGLPEPPSRIIISGHSYGAALATLLALRLAQAGMGAKLDVTTFGSPRVLTTGLESTLTWPHVNVMGPKDVVTRLPPTWGNLRMLISTAASGILGKLGISSVGKFVGGKASAAPFNIPNWTHYGRRGDLSENGILNLAAEGDSDPNLSAVPTAFDEPVNGHLMDTYYWPKLALIGADPGKGIPEYQNLLTLAGQILDLPAQEDGPTDWSNIRNGVFPAVLADNFPEVEGATVDELAAADGVEISYEIESVLRTIGASTGAGGGSMSVWKYTAYVSWGTNGRSVSIHKSGPADIEQARADGMLWCAELAKLFGDTVGADVDVNGFALGTPGNPVIEYLRVSDPLTPRLSQLFRVPAAFGTSYAAPDEGFEADMPWVTVSLSVRATNGGHVTKDVISIVGQPDSVADKGGYNPGAMMPSGLTFRDQLNLYLTYILPNPAASFGTMGRDYTLAPDVPINGFTAQVGGTVGISAPTANWLDGEYIRIKGTRTPYLDREWRVKLDGVGLYTLQGSHSASVTLPGSGTGYRTRLANRVPQVTFYGYSETALAIDPDSRVFISKRDPARRFTPFRSSRSRRTPAK